MYLPVLNILLARYPDISPRYKFDVFVYLFPSGGKQDPGDSPPPPQFPILDDCLNYEYANMCMSSSCI